jgi:CBS domain-containing protein
MQEEYKALEHTTLDAGVGYQRPSQSLPNKVALTDPAIDVMTDLARVAAFTIGASASVKEAKERMISSGVRMLLVTNHLGEIAGILTSRDLHGERAVQHLSEVGGRHDEITVRDIMTAQHRIEVLQMGDVARARVGDIVATLKRMGRQHALVVARTRDGRQLVRGLLSATQIGRQLGMPIDTADYAGTFAALEAALG